MFPHPVKSNKILFFLVIWVHNSLTTDEKGGIIMRKNTIDMIPVLSDTIKAVLSAFSKSRSLPASLVKRSKIILLASQGVSNQAIATQVGLHYNHVATWRNRFLAALPSLRKIEADVPEKLEGEIRLILSDRKRPGARPHLHQNRYWQSLTWPAKTHAALVMK